MFLFLHRYRFFGESQINKYNFGSLIDLLSFKNLDVVFSFATKIGSEYDTSSENAISKQNIVDSSFHVNHSYFYNVIYIINQIGFDIVSFRFIIRDTYGKIIQTDFRYANFVFKNQGSFILTNISFFYINHINKNILYLILEPKQVYGYTGLRFFFTFFRFIFGPCYDYLSEFFGGFFMFSYEIIPNELALLGEVFYAKNIINAFLGLFYKEVSFVNFIVYKVDMNIEYALYIFINILLFLGFNEDIKLIPGIILTDISQLFLLMFSSGFVFIQIGINWKNKFPFITIGFLLDSSLKTMNNFIVMNHKINEYNYQNKGISI